MSEFLWIMIRAYGLCFKVLGSNQTLKALSLPEDNFFFRKRNSKKLACSVS